MSIQNPYANDEVLGEAWEQGYLAGYNEPEVDHFRPFAPEILKVYQEGELSGRDERRLLPPDGGGEKSDLSDLVETALEVGLHVLGHKFLHRLLKAAGGVISLVLLVLKFPTDTPMQPLDDDWTGPADQPDDIYIAVCPLGDHPLAEVGVTQDGYWTGQGHQSYAVALAEMKAHGHVEAFVARCSVPEGSCGAVWPGNGQ